jgi:hypothetical protein
MHPLQDLLHLLLAERTRFGPGPHKTGDPRGVAHQAPGIIIEEHLYQDVAGEDPPLHGTPFAIPQLHLLLARDHYLENPVLKTQGGDAVLEALLHLVLVAGIAMHHIPGGPFGEGPLWSTRFLLDFDFFRYIFHHRHQLSAG